MISLRPATAGDCELVYRINFAPDVRAVSNDRSVVSYDAHTAWFLARVERGSMWIVKADDTDVGVVRIDAGKISIALAAGVRGRGIGTAAIGAACATWGSEVVAEIRTDNIASRRSFERCGFRQIDSTTYRWTP